MVGRGRQSNGLLEGLRWLLFEGRRFGMLGRAVALVGVDKDHDLFRISSALLRITCGSRARIYNANSLDIFTSSASDFARVDPDPTGTLGASPSGSPHSEGAVQPADPAGNEGLRRYASRISTSNFP